MFYKLIVAAFALASSALASFNETNTCILGTAGGCSTSICDGLTNEIVNKLESMGYSFTPMSTTWVHCTSPCIDQLQTGASNALVNAAKSKNDYITLTSAFRSSAQQYLLYKWYNAGQCGITAAAKPGTSNHEGGLAIDTSNYNYWMSTLQNYGWSWAGSSDVVHFNYVGGGSQISAQNLKAFQKLWNANNPSNTIAEDGVYGPDTEYALYHSPCSGW